MKKFFAFFTLFTLFTQSAFAYYPSVDQDIELIESLNLEQVKEHSLDYARAEEAKDKIILNLDKEITKVSKMSEEKKNKHVSKVLNQIEMKLIKSQELLIKLSKRQRFLRKMSKSQGLSPEQFSQNLQEKASLIKPSEAVAQLKIEIEKAGGYEEYLRDQKDVASDLTVTKNLKSQTRGIAGKGEEIKAFLGLLYYFLVYWLSATFIVAVFAVLAFGFSVLVGSNFVGIFGLVVGVFILSPFREHADC